MLRDSCEDVHSAVKKTEVKTRFVLSSTFAFSENSVYVSVSLEESARGCALNQPEAAASGNRGARVFLHECRPFSMV